MQETTTQSNRAIERRNALAYLLITYDLRRKETKLNSGFKREVGNRAKRIGVPFVEVWALCEELIRARLNWEFLRRRTLKGLYALPDDYTDRKGEIVYLGLVDRFRRRGEKVEFNVDFDRQVEQIANDMMLPYEHIREICIKIIVDAEMVKE